MTRFTKSGLRGGEERHMEENYHDFCRYIPYRRYFSCLSVNFSLKKRIAAQHKEIIASEERYRTSSKMPQR